MTRFLLTLLALLTGLVAHTVPAQARIGGSSGVAVATELAERSTREVVSQQVSSRPDETRRWPVSRNADWQPQTVAVPTVRQGVDRARE